MHLRVHDLLNFMLFVQISYNKEIAFESMHGVSKSYTWISNGEKEKEEEEESALTGKFRSLRELIDQNLNNWQSQSIE